MNPYFRAILAAFAVLFVAVGCSNVSEPNNTAEPNGSQKNTGAVTAVGSGFTMNLLSSNIPDGNGGYVWTWEVVQNDDQKFPINHVVLSLNPCVDQLAIIAGYRSSDMETWHEALLKFGEDDNAMGCDDIFDPATLVTVPNVASPIGYVQLVFNTSQYIPQTGTAIWKAGPQCGTMNFMGVGCEEGGGGGGQGDNEGCSYSLGFYHASPVSAYPAIPGWGWSEDGYIQIGAYQYSELEARAIFASKNGKTGMTPAKLSFLQVVAIMLSSETVAPTASVWDDYWTCYNYLVDLNVKLTAGNINSFGKTPKYVQAAAGRIGNWIDTHHCDDLTP